jgi:UPF0716 protein FxsA
MPLVALIAVFILIPLVELYVILKVGDAIGVVWTILILAADSVLGSLLLRSQGRTVWRRFNEALAAGKMPHREVVDGVLVILGGTLLITPGFVTDVVGLVLLVPPTRALVRRLAVRRLGRRVAVSVAGVPPAHPNDFDVEGSATEYEQPPRQLGR